MKKAHLERELKKTRKLRDQWCREYVRVRDELRNLETRLMFADSENVKVSWADGRSI